MVGLERLELSRIAPGDFESPASTNSATRATPSLFILTQMTRQYGIAIDDQLKHLSNQYRVIFNYLKNTWTSSIIERFDLQICLREF